MVSRAASSIKVLSAALCLWISFASFFTFALILPENQLSLVVSESPALQLSPRVVVEKSPGSKPGTKVLCERIEIHGLPRLKHLKKYANSVKVKVSYVNPSGRLPHVEVCFHRNASLGIGMCPQDQWQKLTKGAWVGSMSPYDHKLLDIRMAGSSLGTLQVSLDEEFFLSRIISLVLGIALMTLASSISNSILFYYGGAMTVGILLVILMVLFQGMKLLPTGRTGSLGMVFFPFAVGLGGYLLHYLPKLLRSILIEIGIGEEMYNPLAIFFVVFLIIAGAWLGYWVVRKFVLTEDGSIETGVAHFVAWSIRFVASVMILLSSVDPLLAAEALACGILMSSLLRRLRFIHRLNKISHRTDKINRRKSQDRHASPVEDSYGSRTFTRSPLSTPPFQGSTSNSVSRWTDTETFYSTFHQTPDRTKISKEDWDRFTRESTKKALEGLVSSPDFSKWAASHAERITLAPPREDTNQRQRWSSWFSWF